MIVIGITGHRFLADRNKIADGVSKVLDHIEKSYPGEDWAVLSPLAEGSDQLFVQLARQRRQIRLLVPLPFSQRDYLNDFSSETAKKEFQRLFRFADQVIEMPHSRAKSEAYVNLGKYVVNQSSIMVAIWDGLPAQGLGGTGDVVAWARERMMPLAWVCAGNRLPGTNQAICLGKMQGEVRFENFPGE